MGWTITTIIALALLLLAGKLALKEHRWLRQARTVQGTVVSIRVNGSGKHRTEYTRVSFIGSDGRVQEFEDPVNASHSFYPVGTSVPVAYSAPFFEGRILTFAQRFTIPAILATLGLALLCLRLVYLVGNYYVPRIYLTAGQDW